MTYNYRKGISAAKKSRSVLVVSSFLMFLGGAYMLVNALYPALPSVMSGDVALVTKKLKQRQPDLAQDRLYAPKIGVDVAIVVGVTDKTLEGGAWHRVPQNGDPVSGGNFVLAAHRFNLGLTPNLTRAKSPFYHIDKLAMGDQLFVDYRGVRYAYEVTKRYKVGENELSIESQTKDSRLTMYSCDLRGPKAGREVVEAKPIGTVAWAQNGPQIHSLQ